MKDRFYKLIIRALDWLPESNSSINLGQKKFRQLAIKRLVIKSGENINVGKKLRITWKQVAIGDNSGIGSYSKIEGAIIGNNVLMGQYCCVYNKNHEFSDSNELIINQGYTSVETCVISDDVWIGDNVTILPGIKVGRGCVIGCCSVVTKNLPDYSVVAGNPARILRYRK